MLVGHVLAGDGDTRAFMEPYSSRLTLSGTMCASIPRRRAFELPPQQGHDLKAPLVRPHRPHHGARSGHCLDRGGFRE